MTSIGLRIYTDPGQAEIFINLQKKDREYECRAAIIDTGAEFTTLPNELLNVVAHEEIKRIVIEQAGIARQSFEALETTITLFMEDERGAKTRPFQAKVWFAETRMILIGFKDVLDRAILHIDMPKLQGYISLLVIESTNRS